MQFQQPAFEDSDIDKVITLCKTSHLMDAPFVMNRPVGLVPFDVLPFCRFDYQSSVQSILDVIRGVPGLDLNDVFAKIRAKRYAELPAVFLPK